MTGFVTADGDVWGRPVAVAEDRDGGLYVTDDGGNCVWRVTYPKR
jgi:glucose/arabinose dehydrogenase